MTPRKKPPMTQAEKNSGRYAAEVAAAKRDGWQGRSAALTAWGKNKGVLISVDVLEDLMLNLRQAELLMDCNTSDNNRVFDKIFKVRKELAALLAPHDLSERLIED